MGELGVPRLNHSPLIAAISPRGMLRFNTIQHSLTASSGLSPLRMKYFPFSQALHGWKLKRTGGCLLALALSLIFCLPTLEFGELQRIRDSIPRRDLPNDGQRATFFVLDARPFSVVPEDFYLYVVRSKRVADRGWIGDLLMRRPHQEHITAAPLQVGLGYIAYLTAGRPVPFSLFIFTLLLATWSVFALVAQSQLARLYGLLPVLSIAMVVVTCPSPVKLLTLLGGVVSNGHSDDIWPAYKALRFATEGWSQPLFLAVCVAMARVALNMSIGRIAVITTSAIALLFALGDLWALMLALGVMGLALAVRVVGARWRFDQTTIALGGAAALSGAVFLSLTRPADADATARGGVGPAWHGLAGGISWDLPTGVFLIVAGLFGAAAAGLLAWRRRDAVVTAVMIGALPLIATLVLVGLFAIVGAESWQLKQFEDRSYGAAFLACLLIIATNLRRFRSFNVIVATSLVLFFVAHAWRTHLYITRVAAKDFAITHQLESLEPILRSAPCGSLATLSHEINYLAAVWTNCDLLLPEGFPLHFSGPDHDISQRMGGLLNLYNVRPASWMAFNLDNPASFQGSWQKSRLLSEREGYNYFLMHRRSGGFQPDWRATTEAPDIYILDPVSRQLGHPNLGRYQRMATAGDIEVWAKRRALGY